MVKIYEYLADTVQLIKFTMCRNSDGDTTSELIKIYIILLNNDRVSGKLYSLTVNLHIQIY